MLVAKSMRLAALAGAGAGALLLAGCDGARGGVYGCEDHVDSSVDTVELKGGRIIVTNYHVPGDAPNGPYQIRDGKLTAEINGRKLEGTFAPDGALTINGLTCKKR
jgi:hypothetical protein